MYRRTSFLVLDCIQNQFTIKKSLQLSYYSSSLRRFSQKRRRRPTNDFKTTTKDRLRRLVETNQTTKVSSTKQVNKLLELAQGRLGYLQSKLYKYWNPDYLKEQQRPVKKGPIMDFRWWVWNVLFALVPAMMIGIYCEFRGQHLMHETIQQQELEQMKRIMGEEYVQEHLQELTIPPPQNFVVRAWNVLHQVITLIKGHLVVVGEQQQQQDHIDDNNEVVSEKTRQQESETPQSRTTAKIHTTTAITTKESSSSEAKTSITSSNDPSLQALLDRIQQLEQKVNQQERDRQRMLDNQRNRIQHSGIQNRMEDSMVETWKERVVESTLAIHKDDPKRESPPAINQSKDDQPKTWSDLPNAMKTTIESIIHSFRETSREDKDESTNQTESLTTSSTTRPPENDDAAMKEKGDAKEPDPGQSTIVPQEETRTTNSSSEKSRTDSDDKGRRWWPW